MYRNKLNRNSIGTGMVSKKSSGKSVIKFKKKRSSVKNDEKNSKKPKFTSRYIVILLLLIFIILIFSFVIFTITKSITDKYKYWLSV